MQKSFLRELERISDGTVCENADVNSISGLIMKGIYMDSNTRKTRRFKPAVLIAAAISIILLAGSATAYYFLGASDVFKNILVEQAPEGTGTVPISSLAPVVDKSGAVLNETVEAGGFEVTVRGIIGAGSEVKILVDVEDLSGGVIDADAFKRFGGIQIRTGETLNYDGDWAFGIMLKLPEPEPVDYGFVLTPDVQAYSKKISSAPGGKATFIIELSLNGITIDDLYGETLYLTLTDILQYLISEGEELGADMYEIVSGFGGASREDFLITGGSTTDFINWTDSYTLQTDSGKSVALCDELPDYTVTNAAVWNGALYMRGTSPLVPADDKPYRMSSSLPFVLRNINTGEVLRAGGGGEKNEDKGYTEWTLCIEGITSVDELKDYVLVKGYGGSEAIAVEDEWSFEIPVSFADTAQTHGIGQKFTLGGFELTAKDITISPYYISLNVSVTSDMLSLMEHIEHPHTTDWNPIVTGVNEWFRFIMDGTQTAVFTMTDGSSVTANASCGSTASEMTIDFMPDVVINPELVESIKFGSLEYRF